MRKKNGKKYQIVVKALLVIIGWLTVAYFLFFIDPEIIKDFPVVNSYLSFFIILFLTILATAKLFFSNFRRSFLLTLALVLFLYLRLMKLGHLLNALLLFSFFILLELASTKK